MGPSPRSCHEMVGGINHSYDIDDDGALVFDVLNDLHVAAIGVRARERAELPLVAMGHETATGFYSGFELQTHTETSLQAASGHFDPLFRREIG